MPNEISVPAALTDGQYHGHLPRLAPQIIRGEPPRVCIFNLSKRICGRVLTAVGIGTVRNVSNSLRLPRVS